MVTTRSSGAKVPFPSQEAQSEPTASPKRKKPTSSLKQAESVPNLLEHVELYTQGLQENSPVVWLLPQETHVSLSRWDTFELGKISSTPTNKADSSKLYLCFAGGEVWAWDTLKVESKLFLALSAYRKDSLVHSIYEKYSKPGLIQIWEYNVSRDEKPACIMCIGHEGDFCRQLRWLPFRKDEAVSEEQDILGLMLGCFGDGTLKVLRIQYDSRWKQKKPNEPIFVRSDVLFCFTSPCNSILVTAECSSDGSWIIGGDTKGTLHLWNISKGNLNEVVIQQQKDHIYYQSFPAHQVPIRSLASPRIQQNTVSIQYPNKITMPTNELIASGSMDGCIRIWNLHYPYRPLLEYRLGQSWIYQLEWRSSKELVAALDDGSVRLLPVEESNKSTRVLALHQGACWCVSISSQTDSQRKTNYSISSGGENGEWIYCHDSLWTCRKNKKASCHPWRLAKVEMCSYKPVQGEKVTPLSSEESSRYSLSTFIHSSPYNIPDTAQYIQRPLSTGACVPFPPSIAFHRVFHHFLSTDESHLHSMLLGASFGDGWFLLGTISSWLLEQL
ncbi:hypothetical protein GpartN1_g6336.t1 [Galdieria partita]|uniref:Transducin/WD40 repeat-like superfamily protein n=1 Tax=Galdieria partita TaxID=83374 RepID=A0A9C7UTK1_9RHOD|nr:hypothetical protein GpartN1_g6336.t1 [Galdieria partita]